VQPIDRRTFSAAVATAIAVGLMPAESKAQAPVRANNVVLVHGAYADASSWLEVIPHLQSAGLNVMAVQNSLTSFADDVESTKRILALMDGPTVLVGHSYSRMIITEAGVDPKVTALVYVAARAPAAGEDYTALAATYPKPPASNGLVYAGGLVQLSEEAFVQDFAETFHLRKPARSPPCRAGYPIPCSMPKRRKRRGSRSPRGTPYRKRIEQSILPLARDR
jgi:pimeloyl-ACP methyl ester carboxylesterase